MPKKILMLFTVFVMLLSTAGCGLETALNNELDKIVIEGLLPKPTRRYAKAEMVEDEIYKQQLAATQVLTEIYLKTNFNNYIVDGISQSDKNKAIHICDRRRHLLTNKLYSNFLENIDYIVSEVEDKNKSLIKKTSLNDLTTFQDCIERMERENFSANSVCMAIRIVTDTTNEFAIKYLLENKYAVVEAVIEQIETNGAKTENALLYLERNDDLTAALVKLYGALGEVYAGRVRDADNNLLQEINSKNGTISNFQSIRLNLDKLFGRVAPDITLEQAYEQGLLKSDTESKDSED